MRIVDVTSFFSAKSGGIKRYYREKAEVLPRRGLDCHFVTPGPAHGESALGRGTLHTIAGPSVPFSREYHLFRSGGALGRLLIRLQPDVVEVGSHYFLPAMIHRALAPLGARRPAVVGFFHTDFPRQLVEPLARRFLPTSLAGRAVAAAWRFVRRQFGRYDATLVASRQIADWLAELGVPHVRWVGLGVDVDTFRPPPAPPLAATNTGAPLVTYLGRFSPEKELGLLMTAWDDVHARTGARLRFVGNGPSRAAIAAFARDRPSVSVEPYLDRPADVAAALGATDVAVLTSGTETFSLATAEAMACGTPVVGPARGAVGELIEDSGAGRTFIAGSPGSLGDVLSSLLARPQAARRALGQRGREHIARHFTWDAVATRLTDAYRSVMAS
ncbi:MAG TPA: glycosyltransferase [Polyangia bacterium]|nr:glycosyltransferase [Polyangia bacterium]